MKVGVIGGGVSGLVAAYEAARGGAKVVVHEKEDYLGGHAKTVSFDGVDLDLGFMVFNRVSSLQPSPSPFSSSSSFAFCPHHYRHCIFLHFSC